MRAPQRMMTWQAVQAEVLARIRSGVWPAGELIPTETELAAEFTCARATVNRALTSLAKSGLIERRRKVGTRVAKHPPQQSTMPKGSIKDEIEAKGATFGYRLVSVEEVTPPTEVAAQMMLPQNTQTIEVRAEFTKDGEPYCGEIRWINPSAVPQIKPATFKGLSPEEWLANNAALNHGSMAVSATNSGDQPEFVAEALNLNFDSSLLLIERTIWADAIPVSLSRQFFPAGHTLSALL